MNLIGIRKYLEDWRKRNIGTLKPGVVESDQPFVSDHLSFGSDKNSDPRVEHFTPLHFQEDSVDVESAPLRPGDLVELRMNGDSSSTLAIYLRSINRQQQFYTDRGIWQVAFPHQVAFVHRNFVPPTVVERILPYIPEFEIDVFAYNQKYSEGSVPRPDGAQVVKRLRNFSAKADEIYRDHMDTLDSIYDIMSDESREVRADLETIAAKALKVSPENLSPQQLYATHRAIRNFPFEIMTTNEYKFKNTFRFRTKPQTSSSQQVLGWVRLYQERSARNTNVSLAYNGGSPPKDLEPFMEFLAKARRSVLKSRAFRSPTTLSNVGPNYVIAKDVPQRSSVGPEFTTDDLKIIEILRLFVTGGILESTQLGMACSLILRATGLYKSVPLNSGTCNLFLQEMGVLKPWENVELLREIFDLPGHGVSQRGDELRRATDLWLKDNKPSTLKDSKKELRKDWGDMPVFCIDDVSALEIDDGFSLERIEGKDDEFWIHVHVANPSAFIPTEGPFAEYARFCVTTFYSPDGAYPMIPYSLATKLFSLQSGRPVLTFSSRINTGGEVLEVNVQHGIINNVIAAEPRVVRKALGLEDTTAEPVILSVGIESLPKQTKAELRESFDGEHVEILKTLRDLADARRVKLLANGALEGNYLPNPKVTVHNGGRGMVTNVNFERPRHYYTDPTIQLKAKPWDVSLLEPKEQTASSDLVARMMLLAGESAARWCEERGVPVVFAGTFNHPEFEPVTNEKLATGSALSMNDCGMPRSSLSSTPIPHRGLGMDAYTKVTSPLRRYVDLLAHWQIEAVLEHEAELGRKLTPEDDKSFLPFSNDIISDMVPDIQHRQQLLEVAQSRVIDHWHAQLLFRAFYFQETELPATFQCVVTAKAGFRIGDQAVEFVGTLMPFGIRANVFRGDGLLEGLPAGEEIAIGDVIETKLYLVEAYRKIIAVKPVKVIKRF